ncbi:hypothetical protein Btru_068489 [Bulinus truncatus]|nr:hypothetical protein Btru_068489 [Bulinus truncatus]
MGIWGPLVWYLVLCGLTVWILVYLLILRGSMGFAKVLTIVVPSTAALILIVTIYGYTAVPNYLDSLKKFIFTDHRKHKIPESQSAIRYILSFPEFWLDALDLHVYGLGLWAGILPYIGTHIICTKKIVRRSWCILTLSQIFSPIILLVMLMPFIDPQYPGGILSYEVGVKPGLSYLFVAIPHTFHKHGLSSFILFLIYTIYVMISIQHLSFHILMIWENVWPSLPKAVIAFFKRTSILLATVCFFSFFLTSPYLSQRGLLLYQIVRFYVDHLLFAVVIFSMVPFIIGFIRQETLRMPIDRIFMGVWYGSASLIAACFLVYNLIVFVYPETVERYEQKWIEHLGWCVSVSPCLLGVSLGALHAILSLTGSFKERLMNSVKVGTPPVDDAGDDCLSVDTGDTDLKTPCTSRHNTPMTQARAPLLKHHHYTNLTESHGHHKHSPHTLFPQSLAPLPLGQTADPGTAQGCINSPTAGREAFTQGREAFTQDTPAAFGYGTLQFPKPKATVEVVMKSTSDGNISRL